MKKMIDVDFGSSRYDELVELRYKVLLEPLGLKFLDSFRHKEVSYLHIGCLDSLEDKLVGGLILAPVNDEDIRLMQVAVSPSCQGEGIGRALVEYAQKRAKEEAHFSATPEAQENLAKGEAWLANKATEEGVIKTESGLLYKVIKAGNGEYPTKDSEITMNYRGTLIDGTEFDKNQGSKGIVSNFIPGFTEALLLMDKGAKYEVYIPANLGYGALVQGNIPSNSVLIFEVELTDIK